MTRRARSTALSLALITALMLSCAHGPAFLAPSRGKAPASAPALAQPMLAVGGAALVASLPAPAYAGGMFDFGLTLPFVAVTFLAMMATLNALWFSPVTTEIDDRNAKLLQTLSEATDNLTKADEIQVEYTEQIRKEREKASAAVAAYRETTEKAIAVQIAAAARERDGKTAQVSAKVQADVAAKIAAAESEIERRKAAFIQETLSVGGLAA